MQKKSGVTRVFGLGLLALACMIPVAAQDASDRWQRTRSSRESDSECGRRSEERCGSYFEKSAGDGQRRPFLL